MLSLLANRRVAQPATLLVGLLLAGVSTSAMAGAFAIREQSAVGQGMAFAGMAAGGGESISGMFWNPAVVNDVENYQGENHVTGIFPSSDVKVSDRTKATFGAIGGVSRDGGDIGKTAFLSAGYNAYRINEKLAIGLSVTTPFGLATDPHFNWSGQLYARASRVRSINATPVIGYKINDWISVGGGLQIQYFDIRLSQALGQAANARSATLKGDDVGVGFVAGVTLTPFAGTSIGLGYRSKIKQDLDGKLVVPGPNGKIKADVTLPETVSFGIRQRVTDQLTILGGVEWTNWSRLDKVNAKSRTLGFPDRSLPFGYHDGWFFSTGAEYAVNQALTVRGGVGYELSPIGDKVRSNRLPDDDRWWLSAGASYKYSEKLAFDLGYSYVFVPGKSKIQIKPGDNDAFPGQFFNYDARAKTDIHIVSVALRYKIGDVSAPAPLVVKN